VARSRSSSKSPVITVGESSQHASSRVRRFTHMIDQVSSFKPEWTHKWRSDDHDPSVETPIEGPGARLSGYQSPGGPRRLEEAAVPRERGPYAPGYQSCATHKLGRGRMGREGNMWATVLRCKPSGPGPLATNKRWSLQN
jgi:hypothetical protein